GLVPHVEGQQIHVVDRQAPGTVVPGFELLVDDGSVRGPDGVHRDSILQRREPALRRPRWHARARAPRLALVGEDLEAERVQLDGAGHHGAGSAVAALVHPADGKPRGLDPYAFAAVRAAALATGIA